VRACRGEKASEKRTERSVSQRIQQKRKDSKGEVEGYTQENEIDLIERGVCNVPKSAPKHKKKDKKKQNKPMLHRVLSPTDNCKSTDRSLCRVINQPANGVVISDKIFVAERSEHCFDILTKQLEEAPTWDPMVLEVKPISQVRRQTGATSRLTFSLGGKKLETLAMICLCNANRDSNQTIAWVSNDKVRITEEWQLKSKHKGTMVHFTLHYTFPGKLGRVREKLVARKKVERDIDQMVNQLKAFAEGKLAQ